MKYKCTHQYTHPNMGVLFRKNKIYELTTDHNRPDVICIGGIFVSEVFFNNHFVKMEEE